jgi:hypothetical protein
MALLTADRQLTVPDSHVGTTRRGLVLAVVGLVLVLTGLAARNPTLLLLGLTSVTAALAATRLPVDLAVPAAAMALLVAATSAGRAANAVGVDLLGQPVILALLYLAYAGGVTWRVLRRLASPRQPRGGPRWWAFAPAFVAVATGLLQAVSVAVARSWAFYGTDLIHHMTNVEVLQHRGSLDYAASQYPQGFHMLAALGSVPGAPLDDPDRLLGYDLRLVAGLTWLALALVLWTGASLTVRIGRRLSAPAGVPDIAAVVLGCGALLMNTFLNGFVFLGAAASLLGVVALWIVPLAALDDRSGRPQLGYLVIVGCLSAACLGNLWQPLVLAPACAVLLLVGTQLPGLTSRLRTRAGVRRAVRFVPWMILALLVGAMPVLAGGGAGGLAGVAAIPGHFPGDPWRLLVPGVCCAAMLVRRWREPWARLLLGSAIGLLGTWLVLLRGSSYQIEQWYPVKAAWFEALLLAPLLAVGVTWLGFTAARSAARAIDRMGPNTFVVRATGGALAVGVAFAFWLPMLLGQGSLLAMTWHAAPLSPQSTSRGAVPNWSAEHYDLVTKYQPAAGGRVVVPYFLGYSAVADSKGTRLVSALLDFVTGQPEIAGDGRDVCMAIEVVAGDRPAVVLSKLPRSMVRADLTSHGCAGRVGIIQVPGGIRDLNALVALRRAVAAHPSSTVGA